MRTRSKLSHPKPPQNEGSQIYSVFSEGKPKSAKRCGLGQTFEFRNVRLGLG